MLESFEDGLDGCWRRPEFEAGDEWAVGADQVDWLRGNRGVREDKCILGVRCSGSTQLGEDFGGLRAEDRQAFARAREISEFDVVHDDEVVEVRDERGDVVALGFEQDCVFEHPGGGIGLDASLGVQKEVVAAFAGLQRLDGVGSPCR